MRPRFIQFFTAFLAFLFVLQTLPFFLLQAHALSSPPPRPPDAGPDAQARGEAGLRAPGVAPEEDFLFPPENYNARIRQFEKEDNELQKHIKEQTEDPARVCSASALKDAALDLGIQFASENAQDGINWLKEQGGTLGALGEGLNLVTGGGSSVPTNDAESIAQFLRDRVTRCVKSLRENGFRIVFNDFKKRLLDSMVDDTLRWVKSGFEGKPGFYEDFGQFIKNTGNAALGDVAEDIGLARFCTPFQQRFAQSIQFNFSPPPRFSEQVSCTLTDIVGNVKAFGDNFNQGGWKGYLELAKPQNNRFGQMLLVLEEAQRRKEEAERKAELELIAYQGYKPTKQCVEWDIKNLRGDKVARGIKSAEVVARDYGDRTRYFPVCVKEDITTPGSSVGALADAALTADFQYVTNAGDLAPYFSAIFDGALRRLTKAKDRGLAGIEPSRSSQGKKPETFSEAAGAIVNSPDLTDEEKAEQLQPLQNLAGAGASSSRAANSTERLAGSSQKIAGELKNQLSDITSPSSILSIISQAETLRDQILLVVRGKSADPAPAAEKIFFESFVDPGFVNEATGGLSACQSDTLNAPNCTVAQIQHTSELAEAIAGVGELFPADRQQIQNFITEIDGVIPLLPGASEDALIGINSKLSAIQNQERDMRTRYGQTILALMETLNGTQNTVGLKAELRSCVTYVVEKRRNKNTDVYFCPQLPQ